MLIWSVHRTGEGPMNCFKYFGKDLQLSVPKVANGKLEAMAVAIIRDRIANLRFLQATPNVVCVGGDTSLADRARREMTTQMRNVKAKQNCVN